MSEKDFSIIAIDDGSSAVKWATPDSRGTFQSLVYPKRVMNNGGMGISPASYFVLDKEYTVTDEALEAESTTSEDYQTSEINRVLVHEAIRRSGIAGNVKIAVTLPISRFYSSSDPSGFNMKLIKRKQAVLMGEIEAMDGRELPKIIEVSVYPEGLMGAFFAVDEADKGKQILAIDIGGFTTDISLIGRSGNLLDKTSVPNGTIEHARRLGAAIKRKNNLISDISPHDAMRVFAFGEKWQNVCYAEKANDLTRSMIRQAIDRAGDICEIAKVDQVVFLGGGAHLVERHGAEHLQDVNSYKVAKDPEFSNVMSVLHQLKAENEAK